MTNDPAATNPGLYRVILENERVRVLEYLDAPGDQTTPHAHPASVMITLSAFSRHLESDGREVDVDIPAGVARWLPGQHHSGRNTRPTPTHTIFVDLKEPPAAPTAPSPREPLGPRPG
ncbi:cytoplasmic protein [Cryobacterium sp. TmT2-59]|uniref:cytoplasmic protein n=1 Tax=Cryobacterium sp. TmT2-59 TaxID=1259264 RepID=UPI00106DBADA|nr:cytoplasmic protein [Cryobacterium sp. TmT2-59]TFC89039.1 cytoplasmic protein [Cryobacterium sp. TmT2-59]